MPPSVPLHSAPNMAAQLAPCQAPHWARAAAPRLASRVAGVALLALGGDALAQAPVPTGPPNAPEQRPAFAAQTRAPALPASAPLRSERVAEGLEFPWGLAFVDNDTALVTERPGRLRRVDLRSGTLSAPITGLPEIDARGQGGLLDITLDPDFERNRRLYLSYAEPREGGKNGTTVARATLAAGGQRLEELTVIFRQTPAWVSTKHFGSRLVWDTQGHLYVTLGERSLPEPRQLAQDPHTHLGKVVRIDPDGSIPADNPFAAGQAGAPAVWSYGHRNIQGAALHPESGKLWTVEHGPRGGDELNVPLAGRNYGWPVITYGEDYSGAPIGEGVTARAGMEQPIYYWDPVIAPGDMTFYQGARFPDWHGDLIIASLSPGGLVRLTLDGERVSGEQRLASGLGRVRDVAEGPDGALWALTDARDGALVRLLPGME
ncbi:PQQ-dependent sugar dehydrogenase [Salinicola endophyticus]|uniref:PQQ-dependent sugar dehydrogenase n=1 Tax=Salinicola endophyticus TaxID=1949083 RepID=UPI001FD99B35|nr:PQQ-dependent sugar dehydrogenase [Salinicola endophyticus]